MDCGVDLGDSVLRPGQADLQPFDFPEPSLAFGFDDPGLQIVADLQQSKALRRVRPQKRTSDTSLTEMILNALGSTFGRGRCPRVTDESWVV